MGIAVVTGTFAILTGLVSWLLSNGSKRTRLLTRIERQTAILKDLPPDHPAKDDLNASLSTDVTELRQMAEGPTKTSSRKKNKRKLAQLQERERYILALSRMAMLVLTMAFIAITMVQLLVNR